MESNETNTIRTKEVFRKEIKCGEGRMRDRAFKKNKVGKFQMNHGFSMQTTTHGFFSATIVNAVGRLNAWLLGCSL